jgi:hypothetical protein
MDSNRWFWRTTITTENTIRTVVLNLWEELKTLLKLMGSAYMELIRETLQEGSRKLVDHPESC